MIKKIKIFLAKIILDNPGFLKNPTLNGYLEIGAMSAIQNSKKENIGALQLNRLKSIIEYSKKNVPFWQNLFRVTNINLRNLFDIAPLPITTRTKINSNPSAFLSTCENLKSAYCLVTSGSTSTPLRFYIDKKLFYRRAFTLRYALKVFGQNPWSQLLRFNYKDLPWAIYQGDYIDLLSEQKDLNKFYDFIKQCKPDVFYGTASHLMLLSDLMKDNPLDYGIKFAVSRSEYLPNEIKKRLELIFGCPVFNIYAAREFGPLAQTCVFNNGFHLNEDRFLFEIVDEKNQPIIGDGVGKILITAFDNRVMPFIRYEIGDLGRFLAGNCPCGLQTRRIEFEGRTCDFIYLPDNTKFPIIQLLWTVNLPGEIKSYQFVRKNKDSLTVRIVPDINFNPQTINKITSAMVKKINCKETFNIYIEPVDRIELLSNGKSKILISEIK